jgi:hypothetical protein
MPPIAPGPAGDPQGFGPMAGFGPPPGPMYPNPGPYAAPLWQPAPTGGPGGMPGAGYNTAPHFWMSYEYLLWYGKSQSFPVPLLTTSAPSDQGIIGRSSTLALVGSNISTNPLNGGRVTFGFYGDCDRRFGFEGSGFVTENGTFRRHYVTSEFGIPVLARPFIDSATPGTISSLVTASPTTGRGEAVLAINTQAFSVEADGVLNLYRSGPDEAKAFTLDVLAGYRYFQLSEEFKEQTATVARSTPTVVPITQTGPFGQVTVIGVNTIPGIQNIAGIPVVNGSAVRIVDDIRTRNMFNGFNTGLRGEVRKGMWSFSASGKLAFGYMKEIVDVNGYTLITPAANGTQGGGKAYGGLFANAATIGHFSHDTFAVIPEVNLNLGMAVTRNLTMFIGYNFLYVNNVLRPASELTPYVNTATVPFSPNYGAAGRPNVVPVRFNQDDFWLQGLNTGFTVRF